MLNRQISAFAVMNMNKKKKTFQISNSNGNVQPSTSNNSLKTNDGKSNLNEKNKSNDGVKSEKHMVEVELPSTKRSEKHMVEVELPSTKRMKSLKKKKQKKEQIKTLKKLSFLNQINEAKQKINKKNKKKKLNGIKEENLNDETTDKSDEPDILQAITKMRPHEIDSRLQANRCLDWLISPIKREKFFDQYWEKKPLLIQRKNKDYYNGIFSCEEFDKILKDNNLEFTKNIDITSYEGDQRKTLNPDGRAYAPIVWDHYQNGCSVRLLNPQTFSRSVWKLNSILQEFFASFVGANVYLTPPGSQGFAPHYDDIEAFILQLEGKKQWSVYNPLDDANTLPRFSSKNFQRHELKSKPIISVELEPGDLLYFPRGFIHEAKTNNSEHSLHITLSTYQRNTWGDLFEKLIPRALQIAIEENVEFRRGLPLNYLSYMGVANEDMQNSDRDAFLAKVRDLMTKLLTHAPIDSAADQMGKQFIHDSLPPFLSQKEKLSSIHSNEKMWHENTVDYSIELEPDTPIKLIRCGAVRLVMEDETVRLYHNLENSREYHEYDPQYIDIGADQAPAIECLLNTYPNYVKIEDLPLQDLVEKMEIANLLYDKGLITIM